MDNSQDRARSRSPRRAPKGSGGFRWKDKRPRDNDERRDDRRPHERRDYRDRSPRNWGSDRERGRDRDRDRGRERDYDRRRDRDDRRERRPRAERSSSDKKDKNDTENKDKDKPARKEKKVSAPKAASTEEMIIVNVNDRLGTKAAIPCLPSDTVAQLKLMVAARIGREAGQIMLKRQGERPFKDHICLADYGVSNGVQLDLEVDTGD